MTFDTTARRLVQAARRYQPTRTDAEGLVSRFAELDEDLLDPIGEG